MKKKNEIGVLMLGYGDKLLTSGSDTGGKLAEETLPMVAFLRVGGYGNFADNSPIFPADFPPAEFGVCRPTLVGEFFPNLCPAEIPSLLGILRSYSSGSTNSAPIRNPLASKIFSAVEDNECVFQKGRRLDGGDFLWAAVAAPVGNILRCVKFSIQEGFCLPAGANVIRSMWNYKDSRKFSAENLSGIMRDSITPISFEPILPKVSLRLEISDELLSLSVSALDYFENKFRVERLERWEESNKHKYCGV